MSSSVVSPIAETTTTTSLPARLASTMRCATRFTPSASATEEPPYFCTTMPTVLLGGAADKTQDTPSYRRGSCGPPGRTLRGRRPDEPPDGSGLERPEDLVGRLDVVLLALELGV